MSAYLHQRKLYPHWFTNRGKRFMYFVGAVVGLAIALLGERFWGARVRLSASFVLGGAFALLFALATKLHVFSRFKNPLAKRAPKKGAAAEAARRADRTHFYMSPRAAAHQKAAPAKHWLELRPLTQRTASPQSRRATSGTRAAMPR